MSVATEPLITMTPEAVSKLKEFLDEQGTPDQMLRVFVAPGGCSGLQYGMTVEEVAEGLREIGANVDLQAMVWATLPG